MSSSRTVVVRVTNDDHERLKIIAEHYRLPVAEVARQMMRIGYQPWLDQQKIEARSTLEQGDGGLGDEIHG